MPQPGKPQPVSTGTVRFVRIIEVPIKKNRAPRTSSTAPWRPGIQVSLTVGGAR